VGGRAIGGKVKQRRRKGVGVGLGLVGEKKKGRSNATQTGRGGDRVKGDGRHCLVGREKEKRGGGGGERGVKAGGAGCAWRGGGPQT